MKVRSVDESALTGESTPVLKKLVHILNENPRHTTSVGTAILEVEDNTVVLALALTAGSFTTKGFSKEVSMR
jgi:magnesium-transporting ATPase (P-type)